MQIPICAGRSTSYPSYSMSLKKLNGSQRLMPNLRDDWLVADAVANSFRLKYISTNEDGMYLRLLCACRQARNSFIENIAPSKADAG